MMKLSQLASFALGLALVAAPVMAADAAKSAPAKSEVKTSAPEAKAGKKNCAAKCAKGKKSHKCAK
jgi:hypothetical protein